MSLLDMIKFVAMDALNHLKWLKDYLDAVQESIQKKGVGSRFDEGEDILDFLNALGAIREFCKKCQLTSSEDRLSIFYHIIRESRNKLLNTEVQSQLRDLIVQMESELQNRYCAYIPREKLKYFEQQALFGLQAALTFPEISQDLKDAGNCIAADLNTAAVFHLMRVVEHGLRVLADSLGVRKIKGKPITEGTWGRIIEELDKKATALKPTPNTPAKTRKKAKDWEFYRAMLSECHHFKEKWRNDVMHTRGYYNESEAIGLFEHVERFTLRVIAQGLKKPPKELWRLISGTK